MSVFGGETMLSEELWGAEPLMDAADPPEAFQHLRAALVLWSGSALVGVHAGIHLTTQVKRLEESRLCARDQRSEADVLLGSSSRTRARVGSACRPCTAPGLGGADGGRAVTGGAG